MNWLHQLAEWLGRFKCWYIVRPWERAIRVRCGRWVADIPPGLHVRLPLLDEVFVQNVRLRVLNLPVQTVMSADGLTITLSTVVGWRIASVKQAYERLHVPEDWILNRVLAAVAHAVHSSGACTPQSIGVAAGEIVAKGNDVGLAIESIEVTDFARVKTFRLITGEGNAGWSWNRIGPLETAKP